MNNLNNISTVAYSYESYAYEYEQYSKLDTYVFKLTN